MKCLIIAAVMLITAATSSSAQGITYPGSMWSVNGTASVAEPGNYTSRTHAEQGIAQQVGEKGEFSMVAETTLLRDKLAYDWNRSALIGVLIRYTYKLPLGVIRINGGFETEKRFVTSRTSSGSVFSVDCWFGYDLKRK